MTCVKAISRFLIAISAVILLGAQLVQNTVPTAGAADGVVSKLLSNKAD